MNRRSFLSLLGAALAAPKVASGLSRIGASCAPAASVGPIPYCIWEKLEIQPGEVLKERLFPAPTPREFLVRSVGLTFNPETRMNDLMALLGSQKMNEDGSSGPLWVQIVQNNRVLLNSPAAYLTASRPGFATINADHAFLSGEDFGVEVFTDGAARIKRPVEVTVSLSGLIVQS